MSHSLSFEFLLDEAEQARVTALVAARTKGAWLRRWIGLPLLAVPIVLAIVFHWPLNFLWPYAFVLLLAGALQLLVPAIRRWEARRAFKESPALRGPLTYQFLESGLRLTTPLTSAEISWDGIQEAAETNDMFLMFMTGRFAYYVPKRIVGSRAAELRTFLAQRLGERARSLRSSSDVAVT